MWLIGYSFVQLLILFCCVFSSGVVWLLTWEVCFCAIIDSILMCFFQWSRLVADMGGLLGLFVGISVCTGFEVLELFVDLILVACRRRRGNRQTKAYNQQTKEDDQQTNQCEAIEVVVEHQTRL